MISAGSTTCNPHMVGCFASTKPIGREHSIAYQKCKKVHLQAGKVKYGVSYYSVGYHSLVQYCTANLIWYAIV